jgi:hypothetical protein
MIMANTSGARANGLNEIKAALQNQLGEAFQS